MKARQKKKPNGAALAEVVFPRGIESANLLTKEQLAERLATTARHVELMVYKRRIPVIRLGHRTIRFSWPRVEAALAKLETREVA